MKELFVLLLLIANLTLVSAQWTENLNEELVYYFKLNELSGNTIEHVFGEVNGVVEGATQGVAGKINTAYSFDGTDDRVNFGDVDEVEGVNEHTISLWV